MGRVVKQGRVSNSPYKLNVPAASPQAASNGVSHGAGFDDPPAFDDVYAPAVPAAPPEPEIPQIDWDALHREAAVLLDDAGAQAIALLDDARARAKAVIDEAVRSAQGVQDAARADGHGAGMAEGKAEAERQMNDMLATMRNIVDMARAERRKVIETAEPELVRLAMDIAERVIHPQIALDPTVVIEMTKAAMGRLLDKETITVRVNPADLERVRGHRDEILAIGDVKHLRVLEDNRVDRGGIVMETESGTLDARVVTQVKEARRILHIDDDDDIEVQPATDATFAHPQAS